MAAPVPPLREQSGRPLAHFLVMFMLSILIPSLLLTGGLIWRFSVHDRERASHEALQLARSVTADLDRDFDSSIETLLAFANSANLQNGDLEGFYRQVASTMGLRKLNVLVKSDDGQQLLNTRVPWGTPLPRQELSKSEKVVFSSGKPAISDLTIGAVAKHWLVGLSVPVMRDSQVRYILTMSIDPEHFQRLVADAPLDPDWIIAISDRAGRLIARSREHADYVGRAVHPDVGEWSSGTEGVHRTLSLAGPEVLRGYKWSAKSGWLIAAFIPSEAVDAPLRQLWRFLASFAGAVMALSLSLAYFLARQITGPIASATAAAKKLGVGEKIATSRSPLLEANELSEALAAAARELHERTQDLAANEMRFRSVFEQSAVGFDQVGLDGRLLGVNDRLCNIVGYTRKECLEKTFKAITHPDDWNAEDDLIAKLLNNELSHYQLEKRLITSSGNQIWVRVTSAAVRDLEGQPLYRTSVVEDVTERRKARQAAARLAAIVQASPDALVSVSPIGQIETWNPGAEKLFGYTAEEMIGMPLSLLVSSEHFDELSTDIAAAMRGETLNTETVRRHRDGTLIGVSLAATPIVSNGRITSVSVTMEDIRDRKRRENHILLLNRELAHRVKNTLAVVQSITNQTIRSSPDPEKFRVAFQGRLQVLAAANDLLMNTNWDGADAADFIDKHLAALMSRNSAQLRKQGPKVAIPAELSIPLGLTLHELGTNAIKYGAWSMPGGQVDLTWELKNSNGSGERRLFITWKEHNGPVVIEPVHRGFGATLIERGIPDAKVERFFSPDGLTCTIDLPLPQPQRQFFG